MAERAHFVIGTAGHVDHGKTALVKALTGVDCDRLPEEKARGITIELGFARLVLTDQLTASVIDVPGHERFVRTMVAGAAGIDLVLWVVAADDGVMPQSREHLAVCELLAVPVGVVVITKTDLVDDEMLGLVRDDIAGAVRGTFLEGAEVVACSAHRGEGLGELREALLRAHARAPARPAGGPVFLPIDRVFTRPGFGTVVTGTLLRGEIRPGDALDLMPGTDAGLVAGLRVRGLHVHDQPASHVAATSRVAVNLRGHELSEIHRGQVLCSPGAQRPTKVIYAEIRLLPGARPLKRRVDATLHLGAAHLPVTVTTFDPAGLSPGETGAARILARAPFVTYYGQRLVLRRSEAHGEQTVGGGRVVDPHPRVQRMAPSIGQAGLFFLETGPIARARSLLEGARERGISEAEASRRLPVDDDPRAALQALAAGGEAQLVAAEPAPVHVLTRFLVEAERALKERLLALHKARPLLLGVAPSELEACLPAGLRHLAEAALERLVGRGELTRQHGLLRRTGHDPTRGPGGELLERMRARYKGAGLTPPADDELARELKAPPALFADAITELRRQGVLRSSGGLSFESGALDALRDRLAAHFREHTELSTAAFKELAGSVSRKYAIPLLEWFDAEGLTIRRGDVRLAGAALRPPPPPP